MQLTYQTYRDKLLGCWTGKNIGGVLGAPFEGKRQVNEVDFYQQDLSMSPPPNDDLDLQIVWLAAVERYGRQVNASILGEYWLSYIVPNWVEYGTGKANLRAGLEPPLSGLIGNPYKDSCGCFIRSELWACLAPGQPHLAARYAYEDAIVDHQGEGMYGEIFFAAVQSAAFVESDPDRLIDIGLSFLPEDCAVARCIRTARWCFSEAIPILEARRRIHNEAPGTFGIQHTRLWQVDTPDNQGLKVGAPGFDAPENVAFAVAGWLYGWGDFGRSLCIANQFGEDTDCTCASLGATLGILMGASGLPEAWTAPLDGRIETLCIDQTAGLWIPRTVSELSDRIARLAPLFVGRQGCDLLAEGGPAFECLTGEALLARKAEQYLPGINGGGKQSALTIEQLVPLSPYVVRRDFPAFSVRVDYGDSVYFRREVPRSLRVTVVNASEMAQQQWARIRLYTPEGVLLSGGPTQIKPLNNLVGACAEAVFTLTSPAVAGGRLELIVDVSLEGRHSNGQVKVTLLEWD